MVHFYDFWSSECVKPNECEKENGLQDDGNGKVCKEKKWEGSCLIKQGKCKNGRNLEGKKQKKMLECSIPKNQFYAHVPFFVFFNIWKFPHAHVMH